MAPMVLWWPGRGTKRRIKQAYGLGFSTDNSTSPPSAIVDYCSALKNFHPVSRPIGPKGQACLKKSPRFAAEI
jgi:hypothetical protein